MKVFHPVVSLPVLSLVALFGLSHFSPVQAAEGLRATQVSQRFFALLAAEPQAPSTADAPKQKAAAPDEYPEGKGRDITTKVCSGCHSNSVWASQRHTYEKWSSIIDNMVAKGLAASDDDLAAINQYLGDKFAPPPSKDAPPAATPDAPAK